MRKNKITQEKNDIRILALDDDISMVETIQSYFSTYGYTVDIESNPYNAIERVKAVHYDILLLDFLMSPIRGDKVVSEIRRFNSEIFIILLTGHKSIAPPIRTIRELDIQGYFEKSDRFDQLELLVESCVKSIEHLRTIKQYRDSLQAANQRLEDANNQLRANYTDIVNALRSIVDARDKYTRGHSDRVSYLSYLVSRKMGYSEQEQRRVRMAGLFHDIGKIHIADRILLKDGSLTPEEIAEMHQHPIYSYEIMSNSSMFTDLLPGILGHHEHYDGEGYPQKLKGEEIPEDARIIAVADSFDAMTSFRRYRKNLTAEQAAEQIKNGRGIQFDPGIADIALEILKGFDEIKKAPEWSNPHMETALRDIIKIQNSG